jgi:hypothetical protein
MEKKYNNYWVSLILLLIVLPIVTASTMQSLPPQKQYDPVIIWQSCDNSTYSNISSVKNGAITLSGSQVMVEIENDYYEYQFNTTETLGTYIVNGYCNENGVMTSWAYSFEVNPLGKIFTSAQATLYILVFIVAFVLFLVCIIGGIFLPSNDKRDEMTGYVIAVSNMKYLKILLLCFGYIMLTLMVYFAWMICYGYLDLDFLGNLFKFGFYTLLVLILPLFIIGCYVLISNMVRDSRLSEMLSRGLHVK